MNRILVIDDEESACLVKRWLECERKYELIVATSSKDGLKSAQSELPDLVLLGMSVPNINGVEVLKKLKRNKASCMIPVIVIGTANDPESLREAMHWYAEQYIPEPVDGNDLESAIERILSRAKMKRQPESRAADGEVLRPAA